MGLWVLLVVGGFGFVGFVDVVVLLVVGGCRVCGFYWVGGQAFFYFVCFTNFYSSIFFFFLELEKGKREDLREG